MMTIKGPGRASSSVAVGTLKLRSWAEADDVSLLCSRLQGSHAGLGEAEARREGFREDPNSEFVIEVVA